MGCYDKHKKEQTLKQQKKKKHSERLELHNERVKESHKDELNALPINQNKKNKLKVSDLNHLHHLNIRQIR